MADPLAPPLSQPDPEAEVQRAQERYGELERAKAERGAEAAELARQLEQSVARINAQVEAFDPEACAADQERRAAERTEKKAKRDAVHAPWTAEHRVEVEEPEPQPARKGWRRR